MARIDENAPRGVVVVLRRPWERGVFIAGLAGAVVLGVAVAAVTHWR